MPVEVIGWNRVFQKHMGQAFHSDVGLKANKGGTSKSASFVCFQPNIKMKGSDYPK